MSAIRLKQNIQQFQAHYRRIKQCDYLGGPAFVSDKTIEQSLKI